MKGFLIAGPRARGVGCAGRSAALVAVVQPQPIPIARPSPGFPFRSFGSEWTGRGRRAKRWTLYRRVSNTSPLWQLRVVRRQRSACRRAEIVSRLGLTAV